MKEYGGYIELECCHGKMLHEEAIALNCGRNALAYLCEAKRVKNCIYRIFFVLPWQIFARRLKSIMSFTTSMKI